VRDRELQNHTHMRTMRLDTLGSALRASARAGSRGVAGPGATLYEFVRDGVLPWVATPKVNSRGVPRCAPRRDRCRLERPWESATPPGGSGIPPKLHGWDARATLSRDHCRTTAAMREPLSR